MDALDAAHESVVTFKSDIDSAKATNDPYESLATIQLAFFTGGKAAKTSAQRMSRANSCGDSELERMTARAADGAKDAESLMTAIDVTADPDPAPAVDALLAWNDVLTDIANYIVEHGSEAAPEPLNAAPVDPNSTDFADVNAFAGFLEAHDFACPGTTQMTSRRRDCSDDVVLTLYPSEDAAKRAGEEQLAITCRDATDTARLWVGNGVITLPEIDLIPTLQLLRDFNAGGKSCLDL